MSGKVRPEEAVQATLSSLPDEVVDTVGVTALPSEDSVSERRRKLEYLEMQEELIKVDNILYQIVLAGFTFSLLLVPRPTFLNLFFSLPVAEKFYCLLS